VGYESEVGRCVDLIGGFFGRIDGLAFTNENCSCLQSCVRKMMQGLSGQVSSTQYCHCY
jgi:hypothetical protein